MITVRPAVAEDADVLLQALALAADWRPGAPVRAAAQVLADPSWRTTSRTWRPAGTRGWVAEVEPGRAAGAAWWRFLPAEDPGFGFVSAEVPSWPWGIVAEQRGRGAGTALLQVLVQAAVEQGLPGLSPQRAAGQPAVHLYRRLGFERRR
jgi:GNAT superfamily N-acetyltransferase